MPRLPRLNHPGIPQHIVQRGNNQQVSFFIDDDYAVYLDKLKDYAKQYQVDVHADMLNIPGIAITLMHWISQLR